MLGASAGEAEDGLASAEGTSLYCSSCSREGAVVADVVEADVVEAEPLSIAAVTIGNEDAEASGAAAAVDAAAVDAVVGKFGSR